MNVNIEITQEQAEVICKMDEHLRSILQNDTGKLWENTYIKSQINKRSMDGTFSLSDHIRAMVYSMLSSGTVWNRISRKADTETAYINPVDKIFYNYNPEELLTCSPEQLRDELKQLHCASQYTLKQMNALISDNIPKLITIEKEYGTIDNYYREFIQSDESLVTLVKTLSETTSKDKMTQMEIPLVCEYLRNVGYDIPKPDRHICRILGSEILSFSSSKKVSAFQAFDIISKIAKLLSKPVAEVDYILWSYCSTGYGEICTFANPKCNLCVVKGYCHQFYVETITDKTTSKYLLYSHYGIKNCDGVSEIIFKSARKSYLEFCRHLSYQNAVTVESRSKYEHDVEKLLSDMIPDLLKTVNQESFDKKHNEICEAVIHMYDSVCRQTYGVAQRWLNLTLMNLVVIDSVQSIEDIPIINARRFFHVPVEKYLLEAATTKYKDRFQHGLNLKYAPLRHDKADSFQMDWFCPGETQPFEDWGYTEYIEFQNAVRNKLKNSNLENIYIDNIDWAINAFMEVSQTRNK